MSIIEFTIESETDKAVYVNIPYWLETNNRTSKHVQKILKLWVPKSQFVNSVVPQWIVDKALQELKGRNKFINVDSIKSRLGQYAPTKTKVIEYVPDDQARRDYERVWVASLPSGYDSIDVYYIIDAVGTEQELAMHKSNIEALKMKIVYYI
jgi:hypothetical protein